MARLARAAPTMPGAPRRGRARGRGVRDLALSRTCGRCRGAGRADGWAGTHRGGGRDGAGQGTMRGRDGAGQGTWTLSWRTRS